MNRENNSKQRDHHRRKPKLAERVRPVFEAFCNSLKREQREALKSGNLDHATKYFLAEFIIDLIDIVSKYTQSRFGRTLPDVLEARVSSEMRRVLPQVFGEVSGFESVTCTEGTDDLARLITKEVMLSVQSFSSSSSSSSDFEDLCSRLVPPKRLNNMIAVASRAIKGFICNMACLCCCRMQNQECEESDGEIIGGQDNKLEEIHSEDSNTAALKIAQHIMEKAITDLTMPLLDQVTDPQYKKVLSDSIKESEKLSVEIADSIKEEIQDSQQIGDKKFQPWLQKTGMKIKIFFAKQFSKITILRSAAKLRAKFLRENGTGSSESPERLAERVDSLLQNKRCQSEDMVSQLESLRSISGSSRSSSFTEHLAEVFKDASQKRLKASSEAIQAEVANFFTFSVWWLSSEIGPFTQRVIDLISARRPRTRPAESVSVLEFNVPRSTPPDTLSLLDLNVQRTRRAESVPDFHVQLDHEICKAHIALVLEKLLTRTYKKAKNSCTYDYEKNVNWLLEEVWAELQNTEHITPEKLKNIEKVILEDLCNSFGTAEHVLILIKSQKKAIIKIIAASLDQHLINPKKQRSTIVRFFSTLGNAIAKAFRRTTARREK